MIWIEASRRASETDATLAELEAACATHTLLGGEEAAYTPQATPGHDAGKGLYAKARRYHASVRTLREVMSRHVCRLVATPTDAFTYDHAG